jgi:hypothetical protein
MMKDYLPQKSEFHHLKTFVPPDLKSSGNPAVMGVKKYKKK